MVLLTSLFKYTTMNANAHISSHIFHSIWFRSDPHSHNRFQKKTKLMHIFIRIMFLNCCCFFFPGRNMSHNSRRAPPIECPLASLGHNGRPQTAHQQYHHPLSSSPLNPDVYQMSRTSPILNIGSDSRLYGDADDSKSNSERSHSHAVYSNQSSFNRSAGTKNKNLTAVNYLQVSCNYNGGGDDSDSASFNHGSGREGRLHEHDEVTSTTSPYRGGARDIGHTEQYFLEDQMRKFYIHNGTEAEHGKAMLNGERYYLEDNLDNRIENASPGFLRRPSSPSETSESDRYLIGRISRESPAPPLNGNARRAYNFLVHHHRTHPGSLMMDGLSRLGRLSPSLDQGYHTLASPSPSAAENQIVNFRNRSRFDTPFNKLPDNVVIKIFSWVDSCDLCNISKVCKRFDSLVWRPYLWKSIKLKGMLSCRLGCDWEWTS